MSLILTFSSAITTSKLFDDVKLQWQSLAIMDEGQLSSHIRIAI